MTSVLIHIMDQRASQSRRQLPSETSYSNSKYSSITMLKKIHILLQEWTSEVF